ncbi:HEAT repeat domain-containing protein [Marinivivus vitaminiproducens]|uniref:HEAT repeat domain-containing protein n=1 Tax=Marinivivus vitaminiproducens TaxID=3035935 RepID=UPI0027A576DD|nr:HEAT repeat domain-containing protein [Geminicoccaceae bacterium SCSIO 64248]
MTSDKPILLTDEQMQRFIAHGYLCLKTTLPESFHNNIYARFDELIGGEANQNPGNNLLPAVPEIQRVFDDPAVQGALTSVLGPDYVMHPHRALHNNVPGSDAQAMHKDSYWGYTRRVRNHRPRWVMIMYVPQATPLERGPTGVIPGSQFQMQRPDEDLMPEVPGSLETGGFLLIHYDIWHRKMKNLTDQKRFMMKFEFIRMQAEPSVSWDHRDDAWTLADAPPMDMTAVWARQWAWLRGARNEARPTMAATPADAAGLDDADPQARLKAVNALAAEPDAARTAHEGLARLLGDEVEPVSVAASYALAAAGEAAIPTLRDIVRADDADDVGVNVSGERGEGAAVGQRARNAAYALAEIGEPAIPTLLDLLETGKGRARKLAAFALGEVASNDPRLVQALCDATRDADVLVRINAVEALGLKTGTPGAVEALVRAVRDEDPQVRFSAALSLAQIGPAADAAVPALQSALDDDNRYVPGYAVEALERIATPAAMRALLPFLKTARWCKHTTAKSIY